MTRIIVIATAAVALSASVAAADSYFPYSSQFQDRKGVVELDTVTADADGVVEIYNYHGGEIGDLLGSTDVMAGANTNTRVGLGNTPRTDAIALLKIDGQVVATQEIEFRR